MQNAPGPIDRDFTEDDELLDMLLREEGLAPAIPAAIGPAAGAGGKGMLSPIQEGLWIHQRLHPADHAYNIALNIRLVGPLDRTILEKSIGEILRRHEILRTVFPEVDGNPAPKHLPWEAPQLESTDLTDQASDGPHRMDAGLKEWVQAPFRLSDSPPIRFRLFRMGPESHVLCCVVHHIVFDGFSMGVLFREFSGLYAAYSRGLPFPLPDLAVQYADLAAWQRSPEMVSKTSADLEYWKGELAGCPALLRLPLDHPRPATADFQGNAIDFAIDGPLRDALKTLANREKTTLFTVLYAALQVLMMRWSSQEDFVIAVAVANRDRAESEPLIGLFANALALRSRLEGNPGFTRLMARSKERILAGFAHAHAPFDKVIAQLRIARDASYHPLAQVVFSMQQPSRASFEIDDLHGEVSLIHQSSRFDLEIHVWETAGGISGRIIYARELFDPGTSELLGRHYRNLLAAIAHAPHTGIWDIRVMSERESEMLSARIRTPSSASAVAGRAGPERPEAQQAFPADVPPAQAELEMKLEAIWKELLGLPSIGRTENFFEIGGHSLLAIQISSRISEILGAEIQVNGIFEHPTLAGFAQCLVDGGFRLSAEAPGRPVDGTGEREYFLL